MGNLFKATWKDWEWQNNRFILTFGDFIDTDGDEYFVTVEYKKEDDSWHFFMSYEDDEIKYNSGYPYEKLENKHFLKHISKEHMEEIKKEMKEMMLELSFNAEEVNFIKKINDVKKYVKGELEFNCWENKWYALDYREDIGGAIDIEAEEFKGVFITNKEALEKDINLYKCFEYCKIDYVINKK